MILTLFFSHHHISFAAIYAECVATDTLPATTSRCNPYGVISDSSLLSVCRQGGGSHRRARHCYCNRICHTAMVDSCSRGCTAAVPPAPPSTCAAVADRRWTCSRTCSKRFCNTTHCSAQHKGYPSKSGGQCTAIPLAIATSPCSCHYVLMQL